MRHVPPYLTCLILASNCLLQTHCYFDYLIYFKTKALLLFLKRALLIALERLIFFFFVTYFLLFCHLFSSVVLEKSFYSHTLISSHWKSIHLLSMHFYSFVSTSLSQLYMNIWAGVVFAVVWCICFVGCLTYAHSSIGVSYP